MVAWVLWPKDGEGSSAQATPLSSAPIRLHRACQDVAERHSVIVRCPERLPGEESAGQLKIAHLDLAPGRDDYLIDAEVDGARGDVPFHVIIGGTIQSYSTRSRGTRWPHVFPVDDPLRLVPEQPLRPGQNKSRRERVQVLARATVGRARIIVLQQPEYPLGGLHGGHVVALIAQARASYVLSLHFGRDGSSSPIRELDKPALERQVQLVLGSARSLATVESGKGQP